MTTKTGMIDVHGGQLYYEAAGEGDAIVFIHAGIADRRMWDGQWEPFAKDYRVIRYDMRGYGKSPVGDKPFMAHEDLRAVMDHLGVESAVLVGCSKGGMTAAEFAAESPDRVKGLAMVCSLFSGVDWPEDAEDPPEWDEMMAAHKAGDLERLNELEVAFFVSGEGQPKDRADAALLARVRAMNFVALENGMRLEELQQTPETKVMAQVDKLAMPVLVVQGALDEKVPNQVMREAIKQFRNGRVVEIAETAHVPSMERVEEFNAVLSEFLGGI